MKSVKGYTFHSNIEELLSFNDFPTEVPHFLRSVKWGMNVGRR